MPPARACAMPPSEVPDWRIACGNCGNWLAPFPQVRSLRLDDARGTRDGPTAFCRHRARSPYGGKVLFRSATTPAQDARERARGRVARCINHDNPSLDVPEQCCGLSLPALTQRFGGMFIQFDGSTSGRAGQAMKVPAGSAGYGVGRRGARKRCRLSAGDQCFGHQCFRRRTERPVACKGKGRVIIAGSAPPRRSTPPRVAHLRGSHSP